MVDLAKIRKKAKKVLGVAEEPSRPVESSSRPVVESSSEPLAHQQPATSNQQLTTSNEQRETSNVPSKLDLFKQTAGQRRTTITTEQLEQTTSTHLELLTFTIAAESYAVDIERIVEIVTPRPVTRVPNADPSVVGIISLRGTIVTLVDVRRKLRHASTEANADTRIVVIDFRNETVGFVVDRVQRVVKIAATAVEPHPVVHTAELEDAIRGVFRVSGALTILLDLDKLLDHTPWT